MQEQEGKEADCAFSHQDFQKELNIPLQGWGNLGPVFLFLNLKWLQSLKSRIPSSKLLILPVDILT